MMFLFAELTKEIIFVCTIFLFIYAVTDLCTDFDICPDLRYECSHKICLHYQPPSGLQILAYFFNQGSIFFL